MSTFTFLVETYAIERLKTLSVWSQVPDEFMDRRLEIRARTPREHMVHQCLSEDAWMTKMLGIAIGRPALPSDESRRGFLAQYAACSEERLGALAIKPDDWFEEVTTFFDVSRSRAWVLTRRLTHSAHHRGQLTACLRAWGEALYSTYGPTADTGGLPKNGAQGIYRYDSVDELLAEEAGSGRSRPLPGPGELAPTERP